MSVTDDEIEAMLDAERLARRSQVMLLRNMGMSWADVSTEVGVSITTCRKDYDVVCRDINREAPANIVARHRAVIFDVQRNMYKRLLGADTDAAVDAAKVILKALEREAKLLGLDSPTKILAAVSNEDFEIEAARLIASIQAIDNTALKELTRGQEPALDVETVDIPHQPIDVSAPDGGARAAQADSDQPSTGDPGRRGDPDWDRAVDPAGDGAISRPRDIDPGPQQEQPDGIEPPADRPGDDRTDDPDDDDWSNI